MGGEGAYSSDLPRLATQHAARMRHTRTARSQFFTKTLIKVAGGCSSEHPAQRSEAGVESRPDGSDSEVAIGWPSGSRAFTRGSAGSSEAWRAPRPARGMARHAAGSRRARQVDIDGETPARPVRAVRYGKLGNEYGRSAGSGRWERETSCHVRRGRPRREASRCQSGGAWGLTCRVRSADWSGRNTF